MAKFKEDNIINQKMTQVLPQLGYRVAPSLQSQSDVMTLVQGEDLRQALKGTLSKPETALRGIQQVVLGKRDLKQKHKRKITSLRVIPTVTSYWNIFVTNSDILCAKIWRGREGEDNSDEI